MYQKPQSYEVRLLRYGVRQAEFFVLLGHFLPTPNFWKNEKSIWRCHHFKRLYQKSRSYDVYFLSYGVRQTFCHFRPFFALLPYYWPCELKFGKKFKKTWRYYPLSHVYHKWGSYDVWFLRYKVQQTEFFIILGYFCPLTFLTTQRIKILKKWKDPSR